jgi:hypothetical protein
MLLVTVVVAQQLGLFAVSVQFVPELFGFVVLMWFPLT